VSIPSPSGNPPLFVGRERELAVLRDHVTTALAERGSLVLIGGEAGIGKSALAEVLCHEAKEWGALVLVGRCYDLTETPPFGPWIDLFAHYRPSPDLPHPPTPFSERGPVGAVASQTMLFHSVLDFLAAVSAQHSLVVLLEDAHWQDAASLDVLRFLAREIATLPVVLLVTYRVDELTRRHPLYQLLPALVRESGAARIDLHPLDDAAIRALVDARYRLTDVDRERLVAHLCSRTEGNPLFATELLRTLEDEGRLREADGYWSLDELADVAVPRLLRAVIDGRVARFDAETQRLLGIASVIGAEAPFAVWAAVAGVDEGALLDTVAAVEMGHIVEETRDGRAIRFTQALIREAIHDALPGITRRRIHRRAGEVLSAMPDPDPDAVAHHFRAAGDERAVDWLIRAGERAQRAAAWTTAAERYEAALAAMGHAPGTANERGWLAHRLAVLRRFFDAHGSLVLLAEAAALAEETDDPFLAACTLYYQGLLHCWTQDYGRGGEELARAAEALETLPARVGEWRTGMDRVDARTARGMHIEQLPYGGRFADALRLGEPFLPGGDSGTIDDPAFGGALFGVAVAYAYLGRPAEARAAFARARALFRSLDYPVMVAFSCIQELLYVVLPYQTERRADREQLMREAEEAEAQAAEMRRHSHWARTLVLIVEGEWEEARRLALTMYQEFGAIARTMAADALVPLAYARGERELAQRLVREQLPKGAATEPGAANYPAVPALQRVVAALALDAGDVTTALEWLEAHDRWLGWSGAVRDRAEGHLSWATYHRATGDVRQARASAERALGQASEPRQPLALLAAHRLLGDLDTEARRYDAARLHLDAALTLADRCVAPYERALTLLALANLDAATGDARSAIACLEEARAICAPLGAHPALARAAALAARLGPMAIPAYPAGLSAREVEVLRLVAQGRSNRDIADALFLSEHTVRVHVRNILTKTNTDNRTQAAAFARECDIV
jgi:DNA-binding CsgD family transcriptional regulator